MYFFATIRSSISPSILSTYEKDPHPLQLQTLISNCNNLNTIFGLYKTLINHQQIPTLQVFKNLLTACLDLKQPERAKHIWKDMENYFIIPDYWCFGLLLRVCGKIGDSVLAKKLFLKVKNNEFKFRMNVIQCTLIIQALSSGGMMKDAISVLEWMDENRIKPNAQLYVCLLKHCKDITIGKYIHSHIIQTQIELNVILETTLLNMYSKCGSMNEAQSIFDTMQSKNIVSWNAMIAGYRQNGKGIEALKLFEQMQQEGIQPNHITYTIALSICADLAALSIGREIHTQIDNSGIQWNIEMKTSLLNMYSKCGSMNEAQSIFDTMQSKNIISWTAMISGYRQNGNGKEALKLFEQMQQEGIQPDHITYTIALSVCADLAALSLGREIHTQIDNSGIQWNIEMKNSLLNMYSKCGSMNEAQSIFDTMQSKDIISWNAMIAGYGQNGDARKALELFKEMEMQMVQPNSITFVALLNSFSHVGLVDEALQYFNYMKDKYGIQPDVSHYNCVIDSLGRAGRLEEAENLINTMEQPDAVSWTALLGACRWNNDIERAECAAENALKLDPNNASIYVLLSNIYSAANRWDDAAKVILRMKENGIKKIPGQTWIEINGKIHTFLVDDNSHKQSNEIQQELKKLYNEMIESWIHSKY